MGNNSTAQYPSSAFYFSKNVPISVKILLQELTRYSLETIYELVLQWSSKVAQVMPIW